MMTIDNKTAAETILLAAIDAAMSVPHKKSEHACIALCGVQRQVKELLLVPGADEVHACRKISNYCSRVSNRTIDLSAKKVYNSADSAALEFVQLMLSEQV
jgi:hypothetical protein